MAIRPIKSLSKVSDLPVLRSFKSCREINPHNIFGNLLVSTMEHFIMYLKANNLQQFFNFVLSQIPQAHNEDFQTNYQEVFDDLEDLFEKKQLKILNSLIFDSTFISFLVNLQEMNEVKDCKSSENEKLHLIEHLSSQMHINIMVIKDSKTKTKFCVQDPYVCLTLFEDKDVLYMLFPYEYRAFDEGSDDHLVAVECEDMSKNNVPAVEKASPGITSPLMKPQAESPSYQSRNSGRMGSRRLTSPPPSVVISLESEKRMADRAQKFKLQRKLTNEFSPRNFENNFDDYSALLTRNLSADDFAFARGNRLSVEDFKNFTFKGDLSLDAKERIRWVKETELLKEEIMKREEFRRIEAEFLIEEAKSLEKKKIEIDKIIEEKRKFFEEKRKNEELRLENQRKILKETRAKNEKQNFEHDLKLHGSFSHPKETEAKWKEEKKIAEERILEAELKFQEVMFQLEAQRMLDEQKMEEEMERRIEEDKIAGEERRREEEKRELAERALEAKRRIEREAQLEKERKEKEAKRVEDERIRKQNEGEQKRLEQKRLEQERIERQRLEEERREQERLEEEERLRLEEEEALRLEEEERLRIEEEERIEYERQIEEKRKEDERLNKEKLRIQKLQEEKKKRAQEEEQNAKLAKEKEAERKRLAEEKKQEVARKAEEAKKQQERLQQEQKREQDRLEKERLAEERKKKQEDEKRQAEEKKRKLEADQKKQKIEETKKPAAPVEEPPAESDNTSYCGGLYCAKCARELKRSNYLLKCDTCNDKYLRTHTNTCPPAASVPQTKSCMNCSVKITKGEEVNCIRCFLQGKIFNEDKVSQCTGCVRTDICYWIDASEGEERDKVLCGFCDEKKLKEAVIVACSSCGDMVCLVCLRKNPYVTEGICSHCHNRRQPSLV